jgi:hypothetical protein
VSGERKGSRARGRSGRDPIAADRRRARKRNKLPPDPACVFCGITVPEVLIPAPRSLINADHVSGDANDPDLVAPLCKNCHAIRTAHQHDAGADLAHGDDRSVLARQAAAAQSQAAFFRDLADARERDASRLLALEGAFDREPPGWRDLKEAKP